MDKIILLFMILFSSLHAKLPWTLNSLTKLALENAFESKIASIETSISQMIVKEYESSLYPSFTTSYTNGYEQDFTDADGIQGDDISSVTGQVTDAERLFKNTIDLKLKYTLYDFGATDNNIRAAQQEIFIKQENEATIRKSLKLKMLDLYAQGLSVYLESQIRNKFLELRKELYVEKQRLWQAGKIPQDTLIEDAISIVEQLKVHDELQKDINSVLKRIGYYTGQSYNADDFVFVEWENPQSKLDEYGYLQSPKYNEYQAKIKRKQAELAANKAHTMPTLSYHANYSLWGTDKGQWMHSNTNIKHNSFSTGIALDWTLFDGYANKSASQRLKLELQKIILEREQFISNWQKEYADILSEKQNAQRQCEKSQSILNEKTKKLKMSKRLRKNGKIDFVQLSTERIAHLEKKLEETKSRIAVAKTVRKLQIFLEKE